VIYTEQQRRWWFATHPEYSSGRRNHANETLSYGNTEFHMRRLAELLEEIRRRDLPLEPDPHSFLDVMPFRRLVTSPIGFVKDLFRSQARDVVVNAAKKGTNEGPGKWVEVSRSPVGLQHQSKMSGQPVREIGGKRTIREYELNGVKFDDYRNGKLYEYKGPHGNLLQKDGEFHHWVRGVDQVQDQARRQVDAARGIPVIWNVGPNQVKAFKKALGDIPGLSIEP
jgi:hypothetical protein